MRNLAIVTESLSGGLGRAVCNDAAIAIQAGMNVFVFSPELDRTSFSLPPQATHISVDIPNRISKISKSIAARRKIVDELSKLKCGSIELLAEGIRSGLLCLGLKQSRIVILHGQGYSSADGRTKILIRKFLLRLVSLFYLHSLSVFPEPNGKWKTIWFHSPLVDSIYTKYFALVPNIEYLRLLWLGRIARPKKIQEFIELLLQLKQFEIPFKADVVGDVEELSNQDLAILQSMEEITVHGHQSDVKKYLVEDVVLCLFSESEGKTFAVEEALAYGRPVIVSDLPGHRMMINNSTFLVQKPGDALSAAIALSNSHFRKEVGISLHADLIENEKKYMDGKKYLFSLFSE